MLMNRWGPSNFKVWPKDPKFGVKFQNSFLFINNMLYFALPKVFSSLSRL